LGVFRKRGVRGPVIRLGSIDGMGTSASGLRMPVEARNLAGGPESWRLNIRPEAQNPALIKIRNINAKFNLLYFSFTANGKAIAVK